MARILSPPAVFEPGYSGGGGVRGLFDCPASTANDEDPNNLIDIMQIYADRRIEFSTLMPGRPTGGAMATTDLTDEEAARLTPRILSLQSLVAPLVARSKQDMTQAIGVFGSFRGVCVREFGEAFPGLVLDSAIIAAEALP